MPTIRIDFSILENNEPKLLWIADSSIWAHIRDKPAIVEITMPGSRTPIAYDFVKETVNIFNSKLLYSGCDDCDDYADLPDGVYTITVKGSPDKFNKKRYYLKTDSLRLDINKIYVKTNFEYSPQDKTMRDILSDIEFYIESAKAFIAEGNVGEAKKFFSEAEKLVERNKPCKDCY